MKPIEIPVVSIGPGSQPSEEDGAELQYVSMPNGMHTYSQPMLPELDDVDKYAPGIALLNRLKGLLDNHLAGRLPDVLDLTGLNPANRDLVEQSLGEGEVSVLYSGPDSAQVQETRLTGVWRVKLRPEADGRQSDLIEVGDVPTLVRASAFKDARSAVEIPADPPAGVLNAPSVLVELNDRVAGRGPGDLAHVINLTLLPQTEEDLRFLDECLGTGAITLLSRGYGNCRITATALRHVWWVQHFNSEEKLILNTLEVSDVPEVARAHQEDIDDSAARLVEILDALQ